MFGAIFPIGRGVSGDFAFDECEFEAADPRRLASAIRSGGRGLLIFIHFYKTLLQPAAAHARQLEVGYQMKTAGEIIAFDFAGLSLARNAHAFEAPISECGHGPAICPVRDAAKVVGKAQGLESLSGDQEHLHPEANHASPSGLLANADYFRTTFACVCSDCKKQRTGSGDDDSFSGDIKPGFQQRLQSACAHDVGQSPAGKGQEEFASTSRENQFSVSELNGGIIGLRG